MIGKITAYTTGTVILTASIYCMLYVPKPNYGIKDAIYEVTTLCIGVGFIVLANVIKK